LKPGKQSTGRKRMKRERMGEKKEVRKKAEERYRG
jgi:hypothetical protein